MRDIAGNALIIYRVVNSVTVRANIVGLIVTQEKPIRLLIFWNSAVRYFLKTNKLAVDLKRVKRINARKAGSTAITI